MENTITLTPAMMALVPVVAMLVQVVKSLPEKISNQVKPFLPLVSMGVGVALAYSASIANPIVAGVMIGIAASAGHDTFKAKK